MQSFMKQRTLKIILLSACLCLGFTASLMAQPYSVSLLRWQEGLSNDHVVCITQDKKGFLWFATEEGLNKFDGIRFIPYYKEESTKKQGITGNELNYLLDDPTDSILWIGTQRAGLNAYNYAENTFTSYRYNPQKPKGLITDDITQIAPAQDGNLWISTYWKGIEYFNKQTQEFEHYNTSNVQGLGSDQIWSIIDGGNGLLYVGHVHEGFSVMSVKERKAKNYQHDPQKANSLPGNEVNCIYKDNNGNIWIGTNKGLALFNPQEENFISFNDSERRLSHRVYDIKQIQDNKLWVAMEFGGIAILDLSQRLYHTDRQDNLFTFINEGNDEYGLSNSSIRCLFKDCFNNIWAGSWGGGVNFIFQEPVLFNSYRYSSWPSTENSLSSRIASSVCIDNKGDLWIGTDGGGIDLFSEGKRTAIYNTKSGDLNGNSVQASLRDSKGGLWFGLFYGGIMYFDNQKQTFHSIELLGKRHIDIRSFSEDNEGNIWVGSSNGIYVIDRESKKVKKHYDRENNQVRCIKKDSEGQIWVGFFGGGLGLYDEEMNLVKLFNVTAHFPSNTVNAILEDKQKRLWVATGEGLVCFPSLSKKEYIVYQRENGLANTHIQSVIEDKKGNIWVSTNKGISCIDPSQQTCYNYDHRDNLPPGSFSTGCTTKDADGNLYFGSINGLCYFSPEAVLEERQSPRAVINSLEILGSISDRKNKQDICLFAQQPLQLQYNQNSFSITFNIQNYALVNRVEYAYQLKGMEDSWYTADHSNSVTFRNLPPGTYCFSVKTRMRNQQWSDDITSLDIHIASPLWLTWWAKVLYAMAFFSIFIYISSVYKKKLNAEALYKLEKQNHEYEQNLNNERLRFYTNITHELRTPLTLILGPLEDIQKDNTLSPKDAQKISVIHQSAIRLLNLINQILEFRKTETQNRKLCVSRGNIVPLIRETGLKYKELNQKKNVSIKLEVKEENIQIYFDKEVILVILDNLMSNAIKYTEQGEITLSVGLSQQNGVSYTEIQVSDTGYGINPEALPHIFERYYQEGGKHQASGTGIGLALVKNLVTLHEGEIHVNSTPNVGSTFRISLLTHNSYPNALHADPTEKNTEKEEESTLHAVTNDRPILEVVEDNPDICTYIADALSEHFDVRTASNGKEGMELAQKCIPDIIVSDIMMPVIDGIEMCKTLKRDVRTSHIPIILLTAKDSIHDKEEGYSGGADSYLTKPFSASLLQSRIDNILQGRRKLVEHITATAGRTNDKSAIITEALNKLDNEFIVKINKLIEERLSSDKIDIGYLSDKMCMSSSTLYRKMKALTGLSTNEYVRKMKMKYAEQLLLEGKYNISEIAFKVGINNLFYFRQCFKEEFGMIPSEYLKKLKEHP